MLRPSFAPSFAPSLAAALALLTLGAGCSSGDGESCGPDGAAAGDIVVADTAGSGAELRFHQLRARINNDCPAADAPAGVISVTISGVAVGGTTPLTFCVPRPDLLDGARALGKDGSTNPAEVQLIDVTGAAAGCTYRKLRAATPTGTITASGVCDAGRDQAGFALELAGEVDIERTCGATVDILRMSLTGKVAVTRSDS
jgi:hypothetical protein